MTALQSWLLILCLILLIGLILYIVLVLAKRFKVQDENADLIVGSVWRRRRHPSEPEEYIVIQQVRTNRVAVENYFDWILKEYELDYFRRHFIPLTQEMVTNPYEQAILNRIQAARNEQLDNI